ncbi:MAG: VOC family protein [Candidatus Nanohaloarchaea archaeon]
MELDFVSLTVKDMDRAVGFYSDLLGEEPERKDSRLSFYDLGNIRLSLWNASADDMDVDFGDNCVATFRTEDIEQERERVKQLASEVEEIKDAGGYRLFHFRDTEGNLVEVYEGEK